MINKILLTVLFGLIMPIGMTGQIRTQNCYTQEFKERSRFCDWGSITGCLFGLAIDRADYTSLDCLIKDNESPNVQNEQYNTLEIPVIRAAYFADLRILKRFSEIDVDWEIKSKGEGMTALMFVNSYSKSPNVELRGTYIETSKFLIEQGANVNTQDKTGLTPLMSNARDDKIEFLKLLLEHGADPNIQSEKGETALMLADDNPEIVKALLSASADRGLKDKKGQTAIYYAIRNCQVNKLALLINRDSDRRFKDNEGFNTLCLC